MEGKTELVESDNTDRTVLGHPARVHLLVCLACHLENLLDVLMPLKLAICLGDLDLEHLKFLHCQGRQL